MATPLGTPPSEPSIPRTRSSSAGATYSISTISLLIPTASCTRPRRRSTTLARSSANPRRTLASGDFCSCRSKTTNEDTHSTPSSSHVRWEGRGSIPSPLPQGGVRARPCLNGSAGKWLAHFGRARDLAHPARLVVLDGLHQLFLAVHHEGPVVRHRFAVRYAGEQQQPALAGRAAKAHGVARPEHRKLPVADLAPLVAEQRGAFEDVGHRVVVGGHRDADLRSALERPV